MQAEITAALRQGIADLDEDGVLATVRANLAAEPIPPPSSPLVKRACVWLANTTNRASTSCPG